MYVKLSTHTITKFTSLTDLKFEPETDVTGDSVPVNELWVGIRANIYVSIGSRIYLYDDSDNLWAKYWVVGADKSDKYTVRVHGESAMSRLDRSDLPATMYDGASLADVLQEVLNPNIGSDYTVDQALQSKTISGYCPKQSARVRLQWVCMAIGAYVADYFSDKVAIKEVNDASTVIIPKEDTYWRPKINYGDYVSKVRVTYYTYTKGTPSRTDTYVTIGDKEQGETEVYYIQEERHVTLVNPIIPPGVNNVVEIDGVTLINSDNVDDVAAFYAKYVFKRTSLSLDAIDNAGAYKAGMRVYAFSDEDAIVEGYIQRCSYSFGTQAKASIELVAVEARDSAVITIRYMWGTKKIGANQYRLPVGYSYEIENKFMKKKRAGHTYVFRPASATTSGTVVAGGSTIDVQVTVALDYFRGKLRLYYVDSATEVDDSLVIT